MGFRFQKRIKIIPGVTLNLSKSGISTSLGTTGARVTYGHGKRRTTVGLPGSGISHTTVKKTRQTNGEVQPDYTGAAVLLIIFVFVVLGIAYS